MRARAHGKGEAGEGWGDREGDRRVRVFHFATGKLRRVYDDSREVRARDTGRQGEALGFRNFCAGKDNMGGEGGEGREGQVDGSGCCALQSATCGGCNIESVDVRVRAGWEWRV